MSHLGQQFQLIQKQVGVPVGFGAQRLLQRQIHQQPVHGRHDLPQRQVVQEEDIPSALLPDGLADGEGGLGGGGLLAKDALKTVVEHTAQFTKHPQRLVAGAVANVGDQPVHIRIDAKVLGELSGGLAEQKGNEVGVIQLSCPPFRSVSVAADEVDDHVGKDVPSGIGEEGLGLRAAPLKEHVGHLSGVTLVVHRGVSVRQHLIKEVPDDAALPVTPVVAQDVVSILVKARVGDVIPLGVEDETHPVPLAGTVPVKGLGDDLVEHIGLAAAGAAQKQEVLENGRLVNGEMPSRVLISKQESRRVVGGAILPLLNGKAI